MARDRLKGLTRERKKYIDEGGNLMLDVPLSFFCFYSLYLINEFYLLLKGKILKSNAQYHAASLSDGTK